MESGSIYSISSGRRVIVCGAFPPPVNGLANVNLAVFNMLVGLGMHVDQIDISARGGGVGKLARRLLALLKTVRLVLRPGQARVLYYALSSGFGQYFDLVAIAVARCAGVRVVIHHHNFSYLSLPTPVSRCLFALATRGRAVHVCLCDSMAALLRKTYGIGHEVVIVGNAAFIAPDPQAVERGDAVSGVRVGFLSALTREKGVHDFLSLAEAFAEGAAAQVVEFHVAGNAADAETKACLESFAARGVISFHGAVYNDGKRDYLRGLDVLVFPSRYRHEAQPLVVFEALAAGVAVISHPIACMCDLAETTGVSLAPEGLMAPVLREMLQKQRVARAAILASYRQLHDRQCNDLRNTFLALFI